jgi:hypothetical protein
MNLTLLVNTAAAKVAVWTANNPTLTRVAVLAVPLAAALLTAILAHHPVYASPSPNPPCGTGCGGCGGC